ncbi:peptidylprolyl isomerase [Bacteroidia bacterium]|nr:peptidylprolyl isomerase [Bacteroidia bacterium]
MATLEKIRSKAALLVIVVGVALFAFIIGDFLRSGSTFFHQKKENIAVVDGEAIHYQDYQKKVEEQINSYKARSGNASLTDDEQNQIRQMVLEEMINDILFSEKAEKLGLTVSKAEMRDLIVGDHISPQIQQMPDFQNRQTGRFDKNLLVQFLQTIESDNFDAYPQEYIPQLLEMKKAWATLEQQILKDQLRNKFGVLLTSAILTNNVEAKAAYDNNKVTVDFDYVAQPYSSIPDDQVSVSEAEIKKLYEERKSAYKQEDARIVDFIAVNIYPAPVDFQAVATKLTGLRESIAATSYVGDLIQNNSDIPYVDAYSAYSLLSENEKQFVDNNPVGTVDGPVLTGETYNIYKYEGEKTAPDSIKFNLLSMPMALDDATFKHLADSLIQVVKGGTAFADMANAATNGQSNGDMGWATEAQIASRIDTKFKDEVFGAPLNDIFVAHSNAGAFLVQVTEKTAPVKKYKVANLQVRVTPSQETKSQIYNDLNHFISSHHSLEALRASADTAGFRIQTDVEIAKNQINLGGIQGSRQVIQWAFNHSKGSISDIYECQNSEYFVVAAIEGELKEGFRPLASVSDLLKRELLNEKKGEKLTADLKAKNFTTLEQYAEAMNTTVQNVKFVTFGTSSISGIGAEPILNAEAVTAPVNVVSGPYAGENRVYVIQITNKQENQQPYDEASQRQILQMQNMYRRYQLLQSPQILRENAKIENDLIRFF